MNQPITFFMYCLNDSSNIYTQLLPDVPYLGHIESRVHGLNECTIKMFHNVSVQDGISELVKWIKQRIANNNTEIILFAHQASTEKNALINHCIEEDKDFLNSIKFVDTIQLLKRCINSSELDIISPLEKLDNVYLSQEEENLLFTKKGAKSMGINAISHRFGFGPETHNCADDTIFLLGILVIVFKSLSPNSLYNSLVKALPLCNTSLQPKKVQSKDNVPKYYVTPIINPMVVDDSLTSIFTKSAPNYNFNETAYKYLEKKFCGPKYVSGFFDVKNNQQKISFTKVPHCINGLVFDYTDLDCDDILEQKQLKVSSFIPGIKFT